MVAIWDLPVKSETGFVIIEVDLPIKQPFFLEIYDRFPAGFKFLKYVSLPKIEISIIWKKNSLCFKLKKISLLDCSPWHCDHFEPNSNKFVLYSPKLIDFGNDVCLNTFLGYFGQNSMKIKIFFWLCVSYMFPRNSKKIEKKIFNFYYFLILSIGKKYLLPDF